MIPEHYIILSSDWHLGTYPNKWLVYTIDGKIGTIYGDKKMNPSRFAETIDKFSLYWEFVMEELEEDNLYSARKQYDLISDKYPKDWDIILHEFNKLKEIRKNIKMM